MGKVVSDASAMSAATEAVFSKNGKVEKRIKNFETTGIDTADNILVFPPLADDLTDFDIPRVLETVDAVATDITDSKRKPFRHSTVLVGFIIVITFSWSLYSLFFTVKPNNLPAENVVLNDTASSSSKLVNLETTAQSLLNNSAWKPEVVSNFLSQWNQLNEKQIKEAMTTSWYQLLEFNVKKQLKHLRALNSTKANSGKAYDSVLTLALVMGVTEQPGGKEKPEFTESAGKKKYQQLLAELTNELVNADKRSRKVAKMQDSELALNEKLREQYGSPLVEQPLQEKISTAHKSTSSPQQQIHQQKTVAVKKSVNEVIHKHEIDSVINSYKLAYEKGDLALMATLFGADDKNSTVYKSVTSNFTTTFKNTASRMINFYDTNSSASGNTAVVNGKFNASVDFKGGKGTQYTVANIKLHLLKRNHKVVIKRLDIANRKVNVVKNERTNLTTSNGMISSIDNKIQLPTAAELQDVTTQLVTSYETGDLSQFLSLFSQDIKTNDRIDLSGVQQDYSQLFSSTSDRQMFIQNLKWTKESIGAKGTGDLEVIILSDEGNTVYSMEGKIQIVAQKIDNKVKITHLYHIEREK